MYFFAEQIARNVRNAEVWWSLRDTHMMETLDALMTWTGRRSGYSRAIVWAHNSHLGDARASQMGAWGELNLGQPARERHGDRVFLIGFTTHTGTVTAAREWELAAERRRAIGVIYKPDTERASHYFRARIADQFDAVIHIDTTSALTPLERWSRDNADLRETYPTGV